MNRSRGDRLRRRLATLVSRWQVISSELGLITMGARCPVQRFDIPGQEPSAVLASIATNDIRAVITRPECADRSMITIVIRADHQINDIDRLGAVLLGHMRTRPSRSLRLREQHREAMTQP